MFIETSLFKSLSGTGFPSQDGAPSLPPLSLSSSYYIFSYLFLKPMICFAGCQMSSASILKLFCGIYSASKCSFDEFLREKVVSPSYSSTIFSQFLLIPFTNWNLEWCFTITPCKLVISTLDFQSLELLVSGIPDTRLLLFLGNPYGRLRSREKSFLIFLPFYYWLVTLSSLHRYLKEEELIII